MKSLIMLLSILISVGGFAESNQYIYQVLVPASAASCEIEAKALADRFAEVTGSKILESICQGTVNFPADNRAYPMYALALRYASSAPFAPYSVQIGGPDSVSYSNKTPAYPSFSDCLADISVQISHFEDQTKLSVVSATCDRNGTYSETYKLRIDGFSRDHQARPKKYFRTFSPLTGKTLNASQLTAISDMISTQGAVVVRRDFQSFAYYMETSIILHSETLASLSRQECEVQVDHVKGMLSKLGATRSEVWCLGNSLNAPSSDLHVIYDRISKLSSDSGSRTPKSYSFEQCLSNRELVLSDSRNKNILGGICHPPLAVHDGTYILELFYKY